MDVGMQISLQYHVFIPLDVSPGMGLLDRVLILLFFFFLRNLHVFPSTYTSLHSHQQRMGVPFFFTSSPIRISFYVLFLIIAIPTGVR